MNFLIFLKENNYILELIIIFLLGYCIIFDLFNFYLKNKRKSINRKWNNVSNSTEKNKNENHYKLNDISKTTEMDKKYKEYLEERINESLAQVPDLIKNIIKSEISKTNKESKTIKNDKK